MRVLLVHDYATATGGADLQMLALRDGLRSRGHEVRLLASTASQAPGPAPVLADDASFGTTVGKLQRLSSTANPSALVHLRRLLTDFCPDVVHLRTFLHQLSPLILPPLRDVPTIYQAVTYNAICPLGTKLLPDGSRCHEPAGKACLRHGCVTWRSWPPAMLQLELLRRSWSSLDAVVTLSDAARDLLEAHGLGPIEVIANGVAVRPARPALADPPTAAFAGRLTRKKGVDALLRAFALVVADVPDARLLIAGDGPERESLLALVDKLGLQDRVEFVGHLPRRVLEREFNIAWVQVAPGRWEEPFGNVVTESMMRGTAVVATKLGGPAEIVLDGVTGTLVPPDDVSALADALRALLSDRVLAERLGQAGREVALAEYDQARVAQRFERLYRQVIGDPLRAPSPAV